MEQVTTLISYHDMDEVQKTTIDKKRDFLFKAADFKKTEIKIT